MNNHDVAGALNVDFFFFRNSEKIEEPLYLVD